jgi:hypothetical protein
MTVQNLDHSGVFESNECTVRVMDKQGEPLSRANHAYYLMLALLDLFLPDEED